MSKNVSKEVNQKSEKFTDKFKSFLGIKSTFGNTSSGSATETNGCHDSDSRVNKLFNNLHSESELTVDQKNDINRRQQIAVRLKTIKELEDMVESKRFVDNTCEYVLKETIDLLEETNTSDVRHNVWRFYKCLVRGQSEKLNDLRYYFLHMIAKHSKHDEDIPVRLELLVALTDNGKNVDYCQQDIASFMLSWFDKIILVSKSVEFLALLSNLIKFNASCFDQQIISNFIEKIFSYTNKVNVTEELMSCYQVLDVILCYSHLPSDTLMPFVIMLCKGVHLNAFCSCCQNIMKNLIGTHLGPLCVDTLLCVLCDHVNHADVSLMRGSIHFLTESLWGKMRDGKKKLKFSASNVLNAYKTALDCKNVSVALEITSSVRLLIEKQQNDINSHVWDHVLCICELIISNYDICYSSSNDSEFTQEVHKLLDYIEELNEKKCFYGDHNKLQNILESCSIYRSETSVIRLIEYRAQFIRQEEEMWMEFLKRLMETYYKREKRTEIRIKALDILLNIWTQYGYIHEETIVDLIIMPYLSQIQQEVDSKCREKAVSIILEFAQSCVSAKRCLEILDILERVCKRSIDKDNNIDKTSITSDSEAFDINKAVCGLTKIFKYKLYCYPGSISMQAFKIIVSQLNRVYEHKDSVCVGQIAANIKQEIFKLFLNIRANSFGQIAVVDNEYLANKKSDCLCYSTYIVCKSNEQMSPNTSAATSPNASNSLGVHSTNSLSPPPSPNIHAANTGTNTATNTCKIYFDDCFEALIKCLDYENDWSVLKLVLSELPKLLKNKAMVLSCYANNTIVNKICAKLCSLIRERSLKFNEFLFAPETKLSKADIQSAVFPSLSALIGYQNELEPTSQLCLINCLLSGLVLMSGKVIVLRQIILSLTICAMEMKDLMSKYLTDTLINLSKISATVSLAFPKLEFLSNVILLPSLYKSFTNVQYMSVFAIALPYTNPFKFNEFTVALAYRVIAMWFLKVRLSYRKEIVPFIIKGLHTNVMQEDVPANDTQRLRSSSLNTDQHMHKKLEPRISLTSSPPPTTPSSTLSFNFSNDAVISHQTPVQTNSFESHESKLELIETCMDMLAAYTFGMCSTVPQKSSTVESLLNRSKSETWIIGHKLITITTSSCGSRATNNGLCDKCFDVCRSSNSSLNDTNEEVAHYMQNCSNDDIFNKSCESTTSAYTQFNNDCNQLSIRRRHQSEMTKIRQISLPQSSAFDDLCLNNNVQLSNGLSQVSRPPFCNCECQGWAEVLIRRPTRNTSWIMRLQNTLGTATSTTSSFDDILDLTFIQPDIIQNPSEQLQVNNCFENGYNNRNGEIGDWERASSTPPLSKRASSSQDVDKNTPSLDNSKSPKIDSSENSAIANQSEYATPPRTYQPVSRAQSFGSRRSPPRHRRGKLSLESKLQLSLESQPSSKNTSPDSAKFTTSPFSALKNEAENQNYLQRDRVHTISVMSPVQSVNRRFSRESESLHSLQRTNGLCPKFVFLQLYYNSFIYEREFGERKNSKFDDHDKGKPILLQKTEAVDRSLKCLDRITPYETHKIGVVYVGVGQARDKTAILTNHSGSERYTQFLKGLGTVIRLLDADSQINYVGGLDTQDGQDGKYALCWSDNLNQVIFHVATLMPTNSNDKNCNLKKRHIGNDFVCIVYNDSGATVSLSTIKGEGQCIQAIVIITPYEHNSNLVSVQAKEEFADLIGHFEPQILSDSVLSDYVRQIALHANVGSMVCQCRTTNSASTNWVQRLKNIKRIRERALHTSGTGSVSRFPSDSNDNNIGVNQSCDNKTQYVFQDFIDYA